MSKDSFLQLEIATEVAWQIGDTNGDIPRAESRWLCVDIAQQIIASGIITEESEDIDETIATWIRENWEQLWD